MKFGQQKELKLRVLDLFLDSIHSFWVMSRQLHSRPGALEQPIRPGAVIALGQATASVGFVRPPDSWTPLASRRCRVREDKQTK
jgi:hypothetical protein